MKKFFSILFLCATHGLFAQIIDIDENTQNFCLSDTTNSIVANSDFQMAQTDFITETYQIPGYSLYNDSWDTKHIRNQQFDIPFSQDQIRIILVQSNNNPFVFPCRGSLYLNYGERKGLFHSGIDFKVDYNAPIRSCFDGVVRMAKYYGDYGNLVVVRHYNGLETIYAHLDSIQVATGQIIQAGTILGTAGKSGKASNYMLHFETRFMNEFFNPELFIDFETEELMGNTLVLKKSDFNIVPIVRKAVNPTSHPQTKTNIDKPITNPSTDITTPSNNQIPDYHVVKSGETIYRISLMYNLPMEKVLRMNNLTENSKISVGQKIKLK